ncbi:MAG TPA: hypothetical protein PJ982_12825 [Lacipirellulaceae bacterium]|nr:hypothetical protein [Lacipirellulaceae bacterium]
MKNIDVFYQVEGVAGIEHAEFPGNTTLAALKAQLAKKHGLGADVLAFVEDGEEPADNGKHLGQIAEATGVKLHLHRCRRIEVTVTFNNETVDDKFAPGTTVARVKRWAAEKKFGMSPEETGEHVLQLAGAKDRPSPSTHIGALVKHGKCALAFDLVPDERVNGCDGSGAA